MNVFFGIVISVVPEIQRLLRFICRDVRLWYRTMKDTTHIKKSTRSKRSELLIVSLNKRLTRFLLNFGNAEGWKCSLCRKRRESCSLSQATFYVCPSMITFCCQGVNYRLDDFNATNDVEIKSDKHHKLLPGEHLKTTSCAFLRLAVIFAASCGKDF